MKHIVWLFPPEGPPPEGLGCLQEGAEFVVCPVDSVAGAIETLRRAEADALVVSLPGNGSLPREILPEISAARPSIPVILYDPHKSKNRLFAAAASSAPKYIGQPASSEELLACLSAALTPDPAEEFKRLSDSEPWRKLLVGDSGVMREVVETIALVGNRRATVLLTGETGTGKEIAARAIHMASSRGHSPMVAVNCAALPENLLEAELFGHTRGAFTGAVNARVGLFEQANRSTIFLDEIGEMPMPLQAKLLRVLQERELHRVGSSETIRIDVRVIAASNTDLETAVAQKRFRQDLFYRLNVVPLRMPALRDRLSDIPALVQHFIRKISDLEGGPEKFVSQEAMEYLASYGWPGNVRQLEHAVESAIALSGPRRVLLPRDFRLPQEQTTPGIGMLRDLDVPESGLDLEELMVSIERTLLERALFKCGGNKARAADLLNMKRTTLVSKFKALQSCA